MNFWISYFEGTQDFYRHEFLGPDPRVAGYYYDDRGHAHIRWWDGFLSDQWMGTQKWKLNVRWDGSQWIEHFT